jgi:hypothetical protein
MRPISRRAWLGSLAAATATARFASALGPATHFHVAQLRYSGSWDPRTTAASVIAQEVRFRTSVDVELDRTVISATDTGLFRYPFLLMAGDGRLRFEPAERQRLRSWIEAGGVLFIDNSGRAEPSEAFDGSVRAEVEGMFPDRPLQKIPPQHVLFRTFYVLDFPAGRAIHRTYLEGLFLDERLAVIYSQNDLLGALDREPLGGWSWDVTPGGETQREKAIRLAVNAVQYSLCLDYKDDQVHTDYLLHQRRWRVSPPKIETP